MNRRQTVGAGIVAVGIGVIGLQLFEFVTPETLTLAVFFNTVPFVWIGVAIVYAGYWLVKADGYEEYADTVGLWAVGGGALVVAVVALALVGLPIGGERSVAILLADAGSAGILAGLLVGLYDARSRRTQAEIESMAQRLEGISHYGKALNGASTVSEISALCIQAIELVIGGRGAAFLYDTGGETAPIDSTLPTGWDPLSIVETTDVTDGRQSVRIESGVAVDPGAVDHEQSPDTIDADRTADRVPAPAEGSAVVVSIPTAGSTAFIVLALGEGDEPVDEVQRHLLELLGTHASSGLSDLAAVEYDEAALEIDEPI